MTDQSIQWRRAKFDTEDYFQPPLTGYTNGQKWNGFDMPAFEKDEAKRIGEVFGDVIYDEAGDFFFSDMGYPEEEPERFDGFDIVVDGETVRVYAIGAGFWTWTEEPD